MSTGSTEPLRAWPVRAWVGLGSNLGDRGANLDGAVEALQVADDIEVLRVSSWIETEPVGGPPDQADYLNGVCEIDCAVSPEDLLWLLQAIEVKFGRERHGRPPNSPRTLDCDLLFYGDEELASPDLVVPHLRLEERLFVLEPLN
jgi:2-amino-4-hydroxy-6-hydroxymethyldihydropteridine diphosphokinase